MKLRITLLALFLSQVAYTACAQEHNTDTITANTWAIKGKVLPWIILSTTGINFTLGAEYGFGKVHAIGVDLVYNENGTHRDYPVGNTDSAGPMSYVVSRGVFLYYRRYLSLQHTWLERPLNKIVRHEYLPYVSAFSRYGKTDYYYEKGFETSQVSYDDWEYSAGFLVGIVTNFVDINFGPFYKQKYITDVENEVGASVFHTHMQPTFGFRVGVNLFLVLRKNSSHYLSNSGNSTFPW